MKLKKLLILGIFVYPTYGSANQDIKQCVAEKRKAFETVEPWVVEGSVTCPAADLVGFPPRERRHDRDSSVVYKAPDGYTIVDGINDLRVSVTSSASGYHDTPVLSSDNKSISVGIHCRGTGLTTGRSWHSIRVEGKSKKSVSEDKLIELTVDCLIEKANKGN